MCINFPKLLIHTSAYSQRVFVQKLHSRLVWVQKLHSKIGLSTKITLKDSSEYKNYTQRFVWVQKLHSLQVSSIFIQHLIHIPWHLGVRHFTLLSLTSTSWNREKGSNSILFESKYSVAVDNRPASGNVNRSISCLRRISSCKTDYFFEWKFFVLQLSFSCALSLGIIFCIQFSKITIRNRFLENPTSDYKGQNNTRNMPKPSTVVAVAAIGNVSSQWHKMGSKKTKNWCVQLDD